ncbi:MAG: hypothetical protein LUF85_14775 [Bacteroides sp.]|nr:hypothetical protein [Bacteroides sp.]
MQLISDFITKTIEKRLSEIQLKESFLSPEQENVLNRMGFDKTLGVWTKKVLNKLVNSCNIVDLDNKLENNSLIEKLAVATTEEKKYLLLELERKLFPLKILDLELPCYIVPIKPHWAGQLFDPYISGAYLFGADGKKYGIMKTYIIGV